MRNTLSAIFALLLSAITHAAPVDFIDNGVTTTDTISGLEFSTAPSISYLLPLPESVYDIGGTYEGWRLGKTEELIAIFKNYTGHDIRNNLAALGGVRDFMVDFHLFTENEYGGTLLSTFVEGGSVSLFAMTLGLNNPSDFPEESIDYKFSDDVLFAGRPRWTNFIVRGDFTSLSPVPVPAAAFMFAPALLGFLGLRRRKMQA
jgi:hypothetical protein